MANSGKSNQKLHRVTGAAFTCLVAVAGAVLAEAVFASACHAQRFPSFADQSKYNPAIPEANSRFVILNSGIASITAQKFKLPTDTFSYPLAGLTAFPYYQCSPELKAFLNNATVAGMPVTQFGATPNLPTFSLPPTDLIRMNIPIPTLDRKTSIRMSVADKRRKDEIPWMVAYEGGQIVGIPGDSQSMAQVSSGTMFSACQPHTMVLRCGIMWIMTGTRPAAVLTKNAAVAIRPYSIAAIEQTWSNRLRAANLYGQPLELILSYQGKTNKVFVERGQQRTITEAPLAVTGTPATAGNNNTESNSAGTGAAAGSFESEQTQANSAMASAPIESHPLAGLTMISENIDPQACSYIQELKTIKPPFSDMKMSADFQKMFANYGISPAMRQQEINKQILQRRNLAARPAVKRLGRNAPDDSTVALNAILPTQEPVKFPQVTDRLKSTKFRQGEAKYLSSAVLEIAQNGHPLLKSGEALFLADHSTIVDTSDFSVYMRAGTAAHIVARNGVVAVKCIKETEPDSVKIRIKSHIFDCGAGGEILVGNSAPEVYAEMRNDGIGRRHMHSIETGARVVNKSEIELASLMQYSPTMRKLYKSPDESNKELVRDIMKSIVSVNFVTQDHGGYRRLSGLSATH